VYDRESVAENPEGAKSKLTDEAKDFVLSFVDEIGAELSMLLMGQSITGSEDSTADAISRLDDGNCGAAPHEVVRGCQARKTTSGDNHGNATHPPDQSRKYNPMVDRSVMATPSNFQVFL
jgi:hypothetical protein